MSTAFARLPLRDQLEQLLGTDSHPIVATSSPVGDVTVVDAVLDHHDLIAVAFDWTQSRGSIGPAEAVQLAHALALAATRRVPLVFVMNTSGMRVTDGMRTVAALRMLLVAVLDARLAGQRMYALITHHAFGGASVLASLCNRRAMHAGSILAMSGPKLIERIAGRSALVADDPDAVRALLGGASRIDATESTDRCDDSPSGYRTILSRWLASDDATTAVDAAAWCQQLRQRLGDRVLPSTGAASIEALDARTRRCLLRILGDRPVVTSAGALFVATAAAHPSGSRQEAAADGAGRVVLGIVGGGTATAPLALGLAEQVLGAATPTGPRAIDILVDIETHSADPDDERVVLSEYLALLAMSLRVAHARGHDVRVIVTGVSGGGIFAALSGGASRVEMLHDAHLQVLSAAALAAIGRQATPDDDSPEAALAAGAVDAIFQEDSLA